MKQVILNLWQENRVFSIDNSEANYDLEALKSSLCEYNDSYILVRGDITVTAASETQIAFRNCSPFTKCIKKIDGTAIDDAEDLDLVMSVYNIIEYSSKWSETTGSLWFYSKDEATNFNVDIARDNNFKSLNIRLNS